MADQLWGFVFAYAKVCFLMMRLILSMFSIAGLSYNHVSSSKDRFSGYLVHFN